MSKHRSWSGLVGKGTLLTVLLLLALGSAGCSLLGLQGSSSFDRTAEVRSTIQLLAEAGEQKDADTLANYLAGSVKVVAEGSGPTIVPMAVTSPIDQVAALWEGTTINDFEINVTQVQLQGDQAVASGGFFVDVTGEDGGRSECTGTGQAILVEDQGKWVVTQVIIQESECTVTEPAPNPNPTPNPNPNPNPTGPNQYFFDKCEYLVLGATGEQVKAVQEGLNLLGYSAGIVDGKYGPVTANAVRAFQKANGLYVDGEFGPNTIASFDAALKEKGGYFQCGVTETEPYAGPTTVTRQALRPGTPYETDVLIYESPNPGPTLFFVGGIHGNEQSGHLALIDAIDQGITISRGRVVIVPAFNKIAVEQDRRTLSMSGSALSGVDFNRMFPVGEEPTYYIAREMWELIKSQPDLRFVVDFHDGFVDGLGNTLVHTRQSEAGSVADWLRDGLNAIRPSDAVGPVWRSFPEPISNSLTRKVGRDLNIPAMEVELSGRSIHDPLSLRKDYAWRLIRMLGYEYGIYIAF